MKPQVQLGNPLTADQVAEVRRTGDEWFDIGLSTERCGRPAAEAAVRSAYRAAGLEEPHLVVWMDSPLGGAYAAAMIKEIGKPGQLGGQLWDQLGLELSPWYDAWWLAYYTCALPLAGLENSPRLEALVEANRQVGWWWPMRGAVVLTDRPTVLSRDQQGRLHGENGPALLYADGYAYYGWHGTRIPADLVETGWGVEQIMAETNTEIRRCAIERMGWDQFVTAAGLKLSNEMDDPGNPGQKLRLYDVPRKVLNLPVRVLVCVNATRERDGSRHTFGLTVPTDCKTAIDAAAWSFGVTTKEYRQLARAC